MKRIKITNEYVAFETAERLLDCIKELLPHAERGVETLNGQMVGGLYTSINQAVLDRANQLVREMESDAL